MKTFMILSALSGTLAAQVVTDAPSLQTIADVGLIGVVLLYVLWDKARLEKRFDTDIERERNDRKQAENRLLDVSLSMAGIEINRVTRATQPMPTLSDGKILNPDDT